MNENMKMRLPKANFLLPVRCLVEIITLCAYAQQGYAFGCIGLCTYVNKKQVV